MSQAAYVLPNHRFGQRLGNGKVVDTLVNDGLTDAFNNYHMGITAENIAKKYNKTPAQIILRWHLQRGIVSLPKSVHKERIIQNADIFDFELSKEDMQIMMSMDLRESTGRGYPEQYEY